ncbi:MAG: hypothetical protein JO301_00155 [Chitinophagaceae bacterium]|nr:hypothetical protein [Chitinophagaceae bacterium]
MKPILTAVCCVLVVCGSPNLHAQQVHIQYIESENAGFKNPVIIGKAGDRFVVMDAPDADGTPVWLFGPDFHLHKKIMLPFNAFYGLYGSRTGQVFFTWQERTADSSFFKMVSLDGDGNQQQLRQVLPSTETLGGYRRIITDKKNGFLLFYSLLTDAAKHLVFDGTLFDAALKPLKTFKTAIDYDAALERLSAPVLDTKGNIHIAVYDKLTNYRLSGHLRMNTLALEDQAMSTESFEFEKAKFYDLIFFDNTREEKIELAGFYYDGATRIKQGLGSIQFPYTRNQAMTDKFMPLSQQQRDQLQEGMKSVRRKNDVMDFMKLKDIIEEDGQVFITAWLLDVPNKEFYKDNEHEDMTNTNAAAWLSPEKSGYYTPRTMPSAGTMYVERFPSTVIGVTTTPVASSPQPGGNRFLTVQPNPQRRIAELSGPTMGGPNIGAPPPALQPKRIPSKLAYFHINAQGDSSWQQVLPGDFPIATAAYQPTLWNYPLAEPDRLYFVSPAITNGNEKKQAQFIDLQQQHTAAIPLSGNWSSDIYLSRPFKLAAQKYLSVYADPFTNKNGLALLEIR